ncbi:unnamed protein product, partial [Closterium sp. NIES-64]
RRGRHSRVPAAQGSGGGWQCTEGRTRRSARRQIAAFKAGRKDVLVATDVASKGLDFPDIQHVVNYDMPAEIENYVHRIGPHGALREDGDCHHVHQQEPGGLQCGAEGSRLVQFGAEGSRLVQCGAEGSRWLQCAVLRGPGGLQCGADGVLVVQCGGEGSRLVQCGAVGSRWVQCTGEGFQVGCSAVLRGPGGCSSVLRGPGGCSAALRGPSRVLCGAEGFQSETILLDLKHLLREAKQRIPPVLASLDDPMEDAEALAAASGVRGLCLLWRPWPSHQRVPQARAPEDSGHLWESQGLLGSGGYGGEM